MGISHEFSQPGESLQRAKRDWSDDFTDQHGRRFSAQYDIGNSRPIGELAPVGFTPPWLPSMFYIRWAKAKGGFHFRWDYEALANELVGNAVSYYEQVMEFMLEHMKGEPIPELGDPVPSMVLRSPIGKPPLSPAIVLACQAGDPWGLGVAGAPVNEDLKLALEQSATSSGRAALILVREKMAKLVGDRAIPNIKQDEEVIRKARSIDDVEDVVLTMSDLTYQQFISAATKRGRMSLAEAAVAWAEHKRNVAAEVAA